eukprot:3468607-Pyramimonas_sp.AAC.1
MSMLAVPLAQAGLRWKPSSLGYLLCGGWPRCSDAELRVHVHGYGEEVVLPRLRQMSALGVELFDDWSDHRDLLSHLQRARRAWMGCVMCSSIVADSYQCVT